MAEEAAPAVPAEAPATEAPAAETAPAADTPAAPATQAPAETPDVEMTPKVPEPPAAPAPPKELEEDAKEDKHAKITEEITFLTEDTTLNVMPATAGNLLMTLTEGGMQFLLGGARANCGLKSGRYLFEAKIVEILDPNEIPGQHGRAVHPKQLLRIGFSTADSSLFLGETDDSVCFDSEGKFTASKKSTSATQKFGRDQTLGVLLNLDESTPNANTVSLFRDGVRVSQPQLLPENLKGKTLFPTVTFRNVTLSFNFGTAPKVELPFKCHMIGAAAKKDSDVRKAKEPKDGKYDVFFPVCVPDQGTFDWLDMFLEKHPHYAELSDRMILDWCEKSGVSRNRGYKHRTSNDKPEMMFGIPQLDDQSIRRMIRNIAGAQKRNFVVMEVKSNLTENDRKELLSRFVAPHFKKTAQVLMGEPKDDFKKKTSAELLKVKQEKSDAEFKVKQAEEVRKKLQELKEKELAKAQRKTERAAKRAKIEAEKKAAEEKKEGEEAQEPKPEEAVEEEEEEDEKEDEKMPDVAEEKPPAVELTAEEKKQIFRTLEFPDMTSHVLSTNLETFSMPDKAEGFDEVHFGWSAKTKAEQYFKDWKLQCKLTGRVEDIKPSEWFTERCTAWSQQLGSWKQKQGLWKAEQAKKDKEASKEAPVEKKEEQGEQPEGEEKKEEPAEEKKDEPMISVNDFDFDVFGVANVNDIGTGEPLCSMFGFEDWALLSLRVELHLLAHSFKKDVTDEERPGIYIDNLLFYYNKYFRKTFNVQYYGVDSAEKLLSFIQDTVSLNEKKVIVPELDQELDNFDLFLKLTEEGRKERELLIDTGDDSAVLKFNQTALNANVSQAPSGGAAASKGYYQKGKGKDFGSKGYQGKGFQDKGYGQKGFGGGGNWGGQQMGGMGKGGPQQYGQKGKMSKGYGK